MFFEKERVDEREPVHYKLMIGLILYNALFVFVLVYLGYKQMTYEKEYEIDYEMQYKE